MCVCFQLLPNDLSMKLFTQDLTWHTTFPLFASDFKKKGPILSKIHFTNASNIMWN